MADMISMLPDEVLCHILSFLPTEEVVTTMVLSKRWKPLWPLVSTLDFYDHRYLDFKEFKSHFSFIRFVYATMFSRGLNQPIKNFTLIVREQCLDTDVKVWLNAAIQQPQLENLNVDLSLSILPCSILSSASLVVFKLHNVTFDVFSSVYLPSLKTLHLDNAWITRLRYLMELLYGCPVLEDLILNDIDFNDCSFEGKVKTLSKLVRADVIFDSYRHLIPVKAFSNVEFLRIDECDVEIPVFSNLIHLELIFGDFIKWSLALDMLNHCPKLQTLVFELNFGHDDDDDEVWPYQRFVPECFSSHLRKCFLKYFKGLECQMRFARYVMQNSASLRTMTIHCKGQNREKELEMIEELASYPRSSSNCKLLFE
ncbi:F-box/FBD/LRR-repeat protein At4g26340-like [Lotus japonicus]|uniref:F-box/FBD/LRR-repeat protein At4g26340-like n=1 Tax=Lotus japonicus TaxID=34305 RepID=UPI0025827F95|nr:F-box/FBD/LRR-repeat protein At4g26340-like [Lotus japonicus]